MPSDLIQEIASNLHNEMFLIEGYDRVHINLQVNTENVAECGKV